MITFDLLQFSVIAFAVCGLAAVVLEVVLTNPRWLWEMMSDVRDFAGRPTRPRKERNTESMPTSKSAASQDPRTST
jgi:hypothetical protein